MSPEQAEAARVLSAGRAQWPQVKVKPEAFLAFVVAAMKAAGGALADPLSEELLLTFACAHGDPAATTLVERRLAAVVSAEARRLRLQDHADDITQLLSEQLLVPGGRPRLLGYLGRGPLASWLRVTSVRELLRARKKAARRPESAQLIDLFDPLESARADPQLQYLKKHYGSKVRRALRSAVDALEPRARELLQGTLVGLTIYELGPRYGVHPVTASRWLRRAHADVQAHLRQTLAEELGLGQEELRSILRLVQSRIALDPSAFSPR